MSLEVNVKEEPVWENDENSCGASEAARAGPLADHEVKSELATSSEEQQPPYLLLPDYARVKVEVEFVKEGECSNEGAEHVKTELEWGESAGSRGVSEAAARAGLYPGHVVKDELVLGPEGLQPRDAAFLLRAASKQAAGVAGSGGQVHVQDTVEVSRVKPTSDLQEGTRKRPFSCDKCQKTYTKASSLKRHLLNHSKDKHIVCEVCDKRFPQLSNLNQHKLIHTGEKPYSCDICKKQFSVKGNLKTHILIHTGEKPYSCEICQKKFIVMGALKTHKLKHTGEKLYSCEICKKLFSLKGNLKTHIQIHSVQKPYSCEICKKEFRQKGHLNKHKYIHTESGSYSCEVCQKKFSYASRLYQHKFIHTGQKSNSSEILLRR